MFLSYIENTLSSVLQATVHLILDLRTVDAEKKAGKGRFLSEGGFTLKEETCKKSLTD